MFKMTIQLLANLFSGPATRDYPRRVRQPYPATRGRVVNDIVTCNFCGTCAAKCPTGCLTVDRHGCRWSISAHICIACGICVEACPRHSLRQESGSGPPVDRNNVVVTLSS